MLGYYAERLPAVEINNTFYRLPKASVLESWREQVPPGFRFVLKASRRITHIKRLREAGDETSYLFDTAGVLGQRLGPILFQLPPNFQKDLPRLQTFLDLIPPGKSAAVEFRHASWFEDDVFDCLRTRGCALCQADTDENPLEKLIATARWGYLRLRKEKYTKKQVAKVAEKILAQDWDGAYIFFKDEGEGHGPKFAQQLIELAKGS
ncbi:MAG: hypothetical protein A2Z37_06615 [Chloroflexi bacterium RBG_19FT_COMBO_62_14]|nr:MAG: hypothetical protein A2Z37_06615 [Chloroflexi bacterium RBG_19FT_COMBO_62_14]